MENRRIEIPVSFYPNGLTDSQKKFIQSKRKQLFQKMAVFPDKTVFYDQWPEDMFREGLNQKDVMLFTIGGRPPNMEDSRPKEAYRPVIESPRKTVSNREKLNREQINLF